MSANKIIDSMKTLLIKYNELPYVTIKKNSKYYLIPHRPSAPSSIHFNMATGAINQHSLKYNQYFSPDKIWQKVSQKFQLQIQDNAVLQKVSQKMEHSQKMKEYRQKVKQYNYKYKQPLILMSINCYNLFKKDFFRKIREQKLKNILQNQNRQAKQQSESMKNQKQTKKAKKKGSFVALNQINRVNHALVWKNMSSEERKVYTDMQEKIKAENQLRIKKFVEQHEVPVLKKYTLLSRFISNYAGINGLRVSDPKLFEIYRKLTIQQKTELREECIQMNKESRQYYERFLRSWNISKEQLRAIIQTSDNYRRMRKDTMKEFTRKIMKQLSQFQDQDDFEDFQINKNQDQ